ncbi:MAG: LysR family transcriptional regulator [Bradymonadia bacterium]
MMKLRFHDLELFLAIHRGGSLSQGARALGIDQSTVSRRLAELEERLGAPLFLRNREGVHLTALGEGWVEPARLAEAQVTAAHRSWQRHNAPALDAEVRIAAVHSIADELLVPTLPLLIREHPQLRITILASSDIADLGRMEADIALRLFRPTSGDLVTRKMISGALVPHAQSDLALTLAHEPPERWPWIALANPRFRPPPWQSWCARHDIRPQFTFSSGTSVIRAVQAGLGVSMLDADLGIALQLTPLPMGDLPELRGALWLTAHRAQRKLPHVNAVWKWLELIFTEKANPRRLLS